MMKPYTTVYSSKKDQSARTPSHLVRLAHRLFVSSDECFFDPCPSSWTPESPWNALDKEQPWGPFNFVNPPFNQTALFFDRAIEQRDHALSVFLVPTRFHTRYFAKALPFIRRIVIINQRVRFVGYTHPLQTAMCFVVFGSEHRTFPLDNQSFPDVQSVRIGFHVSPTALSVSEVRPENACVLHGTVSRPLSEITNRDEPCAVLCAARLDNKEVMRALTLQNTYTVFMCPTLYNESKRNKFLEGSMLLSLHGSGAFTHLGDEHQEVESYVVVPTNRAHDEAEYKQLLCTN